MSAIAATWAALACAPRADRAAQLMARARAITTDFEGAWVVGLKAYGESLFHGRAGCSTCHRLGDTGTHFTGPNLGIDPLCATEPEVLTARDAVACRPIAERVDARQPGLSPMEYIVESIMDPDRVITPTYARGVMKRLDQPPVSLTDSEILAVAAFTAGQACPNDVGGIAAAWRFMTPCRRTRDARAADP